MMDKSFPIPFPIKEFKAESDRDIADYEASSQEAIQDLLARYIQKLWMSKSKERIL